MREISIVFPTTKKGIFFTKRIQVGSYTSKKGETKPLHHQIRFIDSFKFLAASLDKLVNNLPKDDFNNVKRYYTDDKFSLLTRKGVYPYEYMNSLEKLKETQLPPREAFYSRLNDEGIGDEDYALAQKVWKTFEMKNLKDYHNLYIIRLTFYFRLTSLKTLEIFALKIIN